MGSISEINDESSEGHISSYKGPFFIYLNFGLQRFKFKIEPVYGSSCLNLFVEVIGL